MNPNLDFLDAQLDEFLGNSLNLEDLGIEEFVPEGEAKKQHELGELLQLSALLDKFEQVSQGSGIDKWFVPGTPFGIETCHKHRAFFEAGSKYNERLFLAGNRCGKSIAGAFEAACHATGDYPSWWAGRTFDGPTHGWAVGSTARATRDTVQKELLGPTGAWGTGMIPRERIGKFWALAGVPQAVDII